MQRIPRPLRMLLIGALIAAPAGLKAYQAYTPVTYTIPSTVDGNAVPHLNLDGKWQFRFQPGAKWAEINVPGEAAMQGFAVPHDSEVTYRKTFRIPSTFTGKRTILRFNGTYSYATLTVNGHKVREHRGGFSRWETDVTPFIQPGKTCTVELTLTDPVEEISYGSGYAHHPICGILRSVELFAVPESYLTNLKVETRLDSTYTDAELIVDCDYTGTAPAKAVLTLTAPDGQTLPPSVRTLTPGANTIRMAVAKPLKWDAEHPNLYTASIDLTTTDGKSLASLSRQIGFRSIEIKGDRMFVNGRQVKLRGACRHDVHPRLGRSTDRATDSIDAVLFKESNMNFVRTSHYPPTEDFIEFCDRLGLYVECETASCFVDTHRQKNYAPGASQDDPAFTAQYLGQLEEMVKSFQTHPSILFWSVGNESKFGSNFRKSYEFVKDYDTTRPAIWSYPGYQPSDSEPIYDILSMHYPDVYGNLWQVGKQTHGFQGEGIPALFDEWAHPACYTFETLRNDPGIREFWGKSLDMMWDGVYNAPGALGGAIWGYVDDVFMVPEPHKGKPYWIEFARSGKPVEYTGNCVGYGDWGIVDIWRRRKPEFWATKKAYSPVRIESERELTATAGQPILLTVFNRFDHTNLNEIKATASHRGRIMQLNMPYVEPHNRATLTIPASEWNDGDSLRIVFATTAGDTIDSYLFTTGHVPVTMPAAIADGTALHIEESDRAITIIGNGFSIPFDTATGLMTNASVGGRTVISSGPYLNAYINLNHLSGAEVRKIADNVKVNPEQWKLTKMSHSRQGDNALITLTGSYGDYDATFSIVVTPQGGISVSYTTAGLPNGYLREEGLMFRLPDSFTTLEWQRRGHWDDYPADAMSGNKGKVNLFNTKVPAYGENPAQPWRDDTHDYFYWADKGAVCHRPLTMGAKAMKENVWFYTLSGNGVSLSVTSPDAQTACRLSQNAAGEISIIADNRWDYPEIAWGNYCRTIEALPCHGLITLQLGR